MSLHYWGKQPAESFPQTMEVITLPSGESVSSAAVTATDSAGTDVSATLFAAPVVDTPYVTIHLMPCAAGVYRIRFLFATTPSAFILEEDVELTVKEI
jgi:hypothetical protein